MKIASLALVAGLSGAVTAIAPASAAQGAAQAQQGGLPGAPPACPSSQEMGAHMARMQAMHLAVAGAKTPAERKRLLDEQRQLVREGIEMMQQMPVGHMGGMGGAPRMGGRGMRGGPGADGCIGQRLEMMGLMMQSLLDVTAPPEPMRKLPQRLPR